MLLERDSFLTRLEVARRRAAAGEGCVALVSGEAGIGKTALVEHFAASVVEDDPTVRVLWGACDALFTPRPLGPLLDVARQARSRLRSLAEGGADRERLFAALLAELASGRPQTVVVLEDVHWADEATLDLLTFLGRRVGRTRGLLVLTYRDDEVEATHPLRRVLGELPRAAVLRLRLPPLSEAAVRTLARAAGRPPPRNDHYGIWLLHVDPHGGGLTHHNPDGSAWVGFTDVQKQNTAGPAGPHMMFFDPSIRLGRGEH